MTQKYNFNLGFHANASRFTGLGIGKLNVSNISKWFAYLTHYWIIILNAWMMMLLHSQRPPPVINLNIYIFYVSH